MGAFWLNDPAVLFKKGSIKQIWPAAGMSKDEKLNAVTRLVLALTLLGYLLTRTVRIVITGLITIAAIVVLRQTQKWKELEAEVKRPGREGFTSPELYTLTKDMYMEPKPSNPAMNVLLPERKYAPERKPAAPAFNPKVENNINASTQDFVLSTLGDPKLRAKLFKDLGDNFTFDQSMRSWYATANTKIPNDQGAFAEYCYGDMISCKEGDALACERNAPPRWTEG
jgi:hypothetical protein